MIAHTGSYLAILNTLFSDSEPLFVIIPHRLRPPLDVVPIFLDAIRPLALGLTPRKGITRLTLSQL
jgi:hypothetical protein